MSIAKFYSKFRGKSSASQQHQVDSGDLPALTPLSANDISDASTSDSDDEWATRLSDGFTTNWDEQVA